jgi:hypothetical protein
MPGSPYRSTPRGLTRNHWKKWFRKYMGRYRGNPSEGTHVARLSHRTLSAVFSIAGWAVCGRKNEWIHGSGAHRGRKVESHLATYGALLSRPAVLWAVIFCTVAADLKLPVLAIIHVTGFRPQRPFAFTNTLRSFFGVERSVPTVLRSMVSSVKVELPSLNSQAGFGSDRKSFFFFAIRAGMIPTPFRNSEGAD